MKAVIWTAYGSPDVLQLQEIEKPVPRSSEVLIRTCAATVTAGDCEARSLKFSPWIAFLLRLMMGVRKPTRTVILGQEFAGQVEAVGSEVKRFKPGDIIFGTTGLRFGAYAEYLCLPENSESALLALKPANMTAEEAATIPTGGLEAVHLLKKANLQPGQSILINGAGGSIGTIAIQLARHYGAEVTAVDSTAKLYMMRTIGASQVIDYTKEDFTRSGKTYDVIFDVIGKTTFAKSIQSLKPNGRYLLANLQVSKMIRGLWVSGGKKVITASESRKLEDLLYLKERIEAGTLKTVIDRRYPLEQTAEAHRYVETGQKKGNVVITIADC